MNKIEYVVKYKVYSYEGSYNPNREEIFTDLAKAIKRRNRINRYVEKSLKGPQYLSPDYIQRAESIDRAMTDYCSFHYVSNAQLFERKTTETEIKK